jgi:hypothetical protein
MITYIINFDRALTQYTIVYSHSARSCTHSVHDRALFGCFSLPPASDSFFLSHPSLSFKSAGCQTAGESEAGEGKKNAGIGCQTQSHFVSDSRGVSNVTIPALGAANVTSDRKAR